MWWKAGCRRICTIRGSRTATKDLLWGQLWGGRGLLVTFFLLDTLTSTLFDNAKVLNFGDGLQYPIQCLLGHSDVLANASFWLAPRQFVELFDGACIYAHLHNLDCRHMAIKVTNQPLSFPKVALKQTNFSRDL